MRYARRMSSGESSTKPSEPTTPDASSDRKDTPLSEAELDAVTGGAGKTAPVGPVPDIDTGQKRAVDL